MGRHVADPETEPLALPGTWPTIALPVRRSGLPARVRPRRAVRRARVDGELVVTGFALICLGAFCGLLTLLTAAPAG